MFLEMIKGLKRAVENIIKRVEALEHDIQMPKYLYHSPADYSVESHPPSYGPSINVDGELLPVPPPECRPGYSPDNDQQYLNWGRSDHEVIVNIIDKHIGIKEDLEILDWGCSSGRVLRHFYNEHKILKWRLHGIDIQAYLIEWMRRNFPPEFNIMCGSTFPHLPVRDSQLSVIYGISVFTHTKYLWDMWLSEFRRVLKPGGLCIQSVQCEYAWRFYHQHRDEDWVKNGHPISMLENPEMDKDFFFYGDGLISQTFYKEEVIKRYWGRYMTIVDFLPPPKFSYQNWIVLKNDK